MKIKKIISLLLALTLMLNLLPMSSFATDIAVGTESIVITSTASDDESVSEGESNGTGADVGNTGTDDEGTGDESSAGTDENSNDSLTEDELTDEDTSLALNALLAVSASDYSDISGITGAPVNLLSAVETFSLVVSVNGVTVDPNTVYDRDTIYTFTFSYAFATGYDPTVDNNTVYYELPDSVIGTIADGEHNLYNSSDNTYTVIGTYVIKNGVVYLIFDTDWLEKHSHISGTFSFSAGLDSTATDNKDEVILEFEGVTDITIKLEDGDVTGSKSYTVNDDGTIDFTITINVTGGDAGDFVLTDTLGSNLEFAGSFYLDNVDVTGSVSVSGQTATANLGTLAVGTHIITYTVNVIDTTNLDSTSNMASWSWNGGSGDIGDKTTITFQKSSISKDSGSVTKQSDGSLLIEWTVWVTPDEFSSVFGSTITDTPGSNQTFTGAITITRSWYPDVYTGSVTDYVNSSGQLVYTFPDSFTSGYETYNDSTDKGVAYRIIYYTTVAASDVSTDSSATYSNTVTDDDGNKDEDTAEYNPSSSTISSAEIVSKSATGSATGSAPTATFTITIDPTGYSGVYNMILNDMLTDNYEGAYVQSSLMVKGASGTVYTAGTDYSITWSSTNRSFTIDFANALTEIVYITYNVEYKYQSWTSTECVYAQNTVESTYTIDGNNYGESDSSSVTISQFIDKTGTITTTDATWTIVINRDSNGNAGRDLSQKTITVTDTIPDGMSYVDGSATYTVTSWQTIASGSITPSVNGNVLTFTITDLANYTTNEGFIITITYKTEITDMDDSDGDGVVEYTNKAQWSDGTETVGYDEETVKIENVDLEKNAAIVSGEVNQIEYSISVNLAEKDLVTSDTVVLSDTLSSNASFILDSITVTDIDGNAIGFTSSYTLNQDGTSTISLTVPDETAMIVTYRVTASGQDGETVTVENVASLIGSSTTSDSSQKDIEIEIPSATATGHNGSLTLKKLDANDVSHVLPDATFDLYIYDLSTGWSWVDTEVTDSDGTLTFGKDPDGSLALKTNILYYYVETDAPEGYELDETKYYFIIKDSSDESGYNAYVASLPSAYSNFAVYPDSVERTVYISNEAAAGKLAISKTVSNADSDTQAFTFTITMASAAGNSYTAIKGSTVLTVDFNSSGVATVTLKDDETITISGLPANADYTIVEEALAGYTLVSYSGNTGTIVKDQTVSASFTNKLETTEITVNKVWSDSENQDGIRPTSVVVTLYKDGSATTNYLTLTATGGWTGTFTNLPKYENGKLIEYEVVETAVVGYTSKSESNADETVFTITNTHIPETISFEFSKVWDDNNNQDGIRPGTVTITLYCNGSTTGKSVTLSESNNWSGSFTDLPLYTSGTANVYTLVETEVTGYTWKVSSWVQSSSGVYTAVITNTHTPETVDISGEKIWDDNNDQDGKRPASITVNLLADGTVVDTQAVTPDSGGNWVYSFAGLDKYKDGKEIVYTVEEEAVTDYTAVYSSSSYDIINSHTPEKTEITVTKVWDDKDDQDGLRPLYIEVKLYADGVEYDTISLNIGNNWTKTITDLPKYQNGSEIVYTIEEITVSGYTTAITGDAATGFTITNSHTTEVTSVSVTKVWDDTGYETERDAYAVTLTGVANGAVIYTDTQTISASDNGYTWTNLDKYYGGYLITYLVDETTVPDGYVKDVTQDSTYEFTITNTYAPDYTSVTVVKYWQDNGNQDGLRASYEVTITGKVGDTVVYTDSQMLSATDRTYTWTNLDKYYSGSEIVYTVEESTIPTGYTAEITGDASTEFVIVNTHIPETTDISVTKVWDDNNNQDGIRPARVVVSLLADGTVYREVSLSVDLATDSNTWSYTFSDLPVYSSNGSKIVYTVQEITSVDGYTVSSPTGDADSGFTITNSHTPETVTIGGTKTWDDADDQDGLRPASITVYLLKNGVRTGDSATVTADSNGDWTYTFSGTYPKYENGELVIYTVEEETVDGYTATYHGYNIINTHTPETVSVSGRKSWRDSYDQYGTRPDSITIRLLADGTEIDSVTVTEADGWAWSFGSLPKYKDGTEITYTITEDDVVGYTATISGYNVVNTLETTSVTAVKYWNDNGNQDGLRTDYTVTITGTAGGSTVYTDSQVLTPETTGYTWNNLPKYHYDADTGAEVEIVYTVEETVVPNGYTASYSTDDTTGIITITNTHDSETTSVSVNKVWADSSDKDGIRPDGVTVILLADGVEVETVELSESNSWSYEWTGLAKYSGGTEIVYTVEESDVPSGYTAEVTGDAGTGFTVTNTHTPNEGPSQKYTNLKVTKVWDDDDNADGIRPASVTILLCQNGVATGRTITLSEANNWTASFTNLPINNGSTVYNYTVVELDVPEGYKATVTNDYAWQYTVTNTHEPEIVELEEPEESTDTETEDDGDTSAEEAPTESNPVTGITLSILPMVIAALAAASSKRR